MRERDDIEYVDTTNGIQCGELAAYLAKFLREDHSVVQILVCIDHALFARYPEGTIKRSTERYPVPCIEVRSLAPGMRQAIVALHELREMATA